MPFLVVVVVLFGTAFGGAIAATVFTPKNAEQPVLVPSPEAALVVTPTVQRRQSSSNPFGVGA